MVNSSSWDRQRIILGRSEYTYMVNVFLQGWEKQITTGALLQEHSGIKSIKKDSEQTIGSLDDDRTLFVSLRDTPEYPEACISVIIVLYLI